MVDNREFMEIHQDLISISFFTRYCIITQSCVGGLCEGLVAEAQVVVSQLLGRVEGKKLKASDELEISSGKLQGATGQSAVDGFNVITGLGVVIWLNWERLLV